MPRRPATADEELIGAEDASILSEITDEKRLERMQAELAMGFQALAAAPRAVSVFGSARTPVGTPEYELARVVGRRLGEAGFAVITGGGPGTMEAAHRGAHDAGVQSIALNIDLPFEQATDAWTDISLDFHYFFCRKVMFVRYASAFVVLPGGYGTLDELFEALCLIQTHKIRFFPVILIGVAYWSGLLAWLRDAGARRRQHQLRRPRPRASDGRSRRGRRADPSRRRGAAALMRMRGLEPPRPEGHRHLKPARLPFRHIRWLAQP